MLGPVRAELDNLRAAVIWSLDSDLRTTRSSPSASSRRWRRPDRRAPGTGVGMWAEQVLAGSRGFDAGRRSLVLASAGLEAVDAGDPSRGRALALEAIGDGLIRRVRSPAMPSSCCRSRTRLLGESARAFEILEVDAPQALDESGRGRRGARRAAAVIRCGRRRGRLGARPGSSRTRWRARRTSPKETGPGGVFPFVQASVTWQQEPVRARDALETWLHGAHTIGGREHPRSRALPPGAAEDLRRRPRRAGGAA